MEATILSGNLENLRASQLNQLKKLEKRKSFSEGIISFDLAKYITGLSLDLNRQIGLLIDRQNIVRFVVVGTNKEIVIPILKRFGLIPGKLRGLRLVHTHLYGEDFTDDDITDLALLRLDSLSILHFSENGEPEKLKTAYLLPPNPENKIYDILPETSIHNQIEDYISFISSLEKEMQEKSQVLKNNNPFPSAILVGIYPSKKEASDKMAELKELTESAMLMVLDTYTQIKQEIHPKYVIGPGRLKEILIKAMQLSTDFLIFDNILSPAQAKNISDMTELKILDRAQLILDIFARRAKSNEGKLRVELAQLKHILPRLSVRDDSLSRLTGGIGGRGPGETKLEIDRRRINDRIAFLSKKLKEIERVRVTQKSRRIKNKLPIVSIIGYTNAGKSTLLNALTNSDIFADNLMFATLDTSSKRLRFPKEREVIITDTVGFIRDLPENLKGAFKSTLEELRDSDLLLHVIDISNDNFEKHISSVNNILDELGLGDKPRVMVFNKVDKVNDELIENIKNFYPEAIFISALNRKSFDILLDEIQLVLFKEGKNVDITY